MGLAREQGSSLVLVTHDERLSTLADRRLVVEHGSVRPLAGGRAEAALP